MRMHKRFLAGLICLGLALAFLPLAAGTYASSGTPLAEQVPAAQMDDEGNAIPF